MVSYQNTCWRTDGPRNGAQPVQVEFEPSGVVVVGVGDVIAGEELID